MLHRGTRLPYLLHMIHYLKYWARRKFARINKSTVGGGRVTPEFVTSLKDNEIFVFGCRRSGRHWEGAAAYALEHFGAIFEKGEGIQGRSYAIPTAGVGLKVINEAVGRFIRYAKEHPEKHFLVTPVGCGLGGWRVSMIAPMFADAVSLSNVSLPADFWEFLQCGLPSAPR